jgi:HSP20 family protein
MQPQAVFLADAYAIAAEPPASQAGTVYAFTLGTRPRVGEHGNLSRCALLSEEVTMAITPYRPATDLFGSLLEDAFRTPGWGGRMGGLLRAPEADVVETENEIRVTVELPGMRSEDIDVDLENNVLTIAGEKQQEYEEQGEKNTWHLSERRYGKFSRSFVLPRDLDSEKIQAHFENGILNVAIPKSERARRRSGSPPCGGGQKRVEATGGQKRNEVGDGGNE